MALESIRNGYRRRGRRKPAVMTLKKLTVGDGDGSGNAGQDDEDSKNLNPAPDQRMT
jgi:hypothetical protein